MSTVDEEALRAEVAATIKSEKGNYCPIVVRNAWHASGTFDKTDGTGGSDGATMRFEPELTDIANGGLTIVHDLLAPVKEKFPDVSVADIWTLAGAESITSTGGPKIPFTFGRKDATGTEDPTVVPPNGRLPPPMKDADGLREIFGRMGFDDRGIVALSGAHTLGKCNKNRSGFDGPWTKTPLTFNNEYFKNLLEIEWTMREWEGPPQYTDPSGELMMLKTDIALINDPEMKKIVEEYAADEKKFFDDYAAAFGKLMALGCPFHK